MHVNQDLDFSNNVDGCSFMSVCTIGKKTSAAGLYFTCF